MIARENQFQVSNFHHPRFKMVLAKDCPFLFTTSITYCTAIAFIHRHNGEIMRIGLYHSKSEQAYLASDQFIVDCIQKKSYDNFFSSNQDNGAYLIKAISDFAKNIQAGSLDIIIHNNGTYTSEHSHQFDINRICTNIQNTIRATQGIHRECQISDVTYQSQLGGSIFYLTSNGFYLGCNGIINDNTLGSLIASYILNLMTDSNTKIDKKINKLLPSAQSNYADWAAIFNAMQQLIYNHHKKHPLWKGTFFNSIADEARTNTNIYKRIYDAVDMFDKCQSINNLVITNAYSSATIYSPFC